MDSSRHEQAVPPATGGPDQARSSPPFDMVVEKDGAVQVVRLSGEFDMLYERRFDQVIREHPLDGIAKVVLDLSNVTFIDSTGLRSILRYWSNVRRARLRAGDRSRFASGAARAGRHRRRQGAAEGRSARERRQRQGSRHAVSHRNCANCRMSVYIPSFVTPPEQCPSCSAELVARPEALLFEVSPGSRC